MTTEKIIQAAADIIALVEKDEFTEFTEWWLDMDAHNVHTDIKKRVESPEELFELCCGWIQRKLYAVAADLAEDEAASAAVIDMIEAKAAEWYEKPKKRLRTASRAGEVLKVGFSRITVPTLREYRNAFTFKEAGDAYLMPVKMDNLRFEKGKLFFVDERVREVSMAELRDLKTQEIIKDIDTTTLLFYYTQMWQMWQAWEAAVEMKSRGETPTFSPTLRFYLPDLATARGLKANRGQNSIDAIKAEASQFHNVVGVMFEGYSSPSLYPVLLFEGYDSKDNTISLSSPYLMHVINAMSRRSVCTGKNGKPITKRNGIPKRKAVNTYAVHPDIFKERNKAAVQNVLIIVQGIETAGGTEYKIKASTLIDRNPVFKDQLTASTNARQLLKRNFSKTWELLRTKTDLAKMYQGITLPDPRDPQNIPTVKGLRDFVITIAHGGKVKK